VTQLQEALGQLAVHGVPLDARMPLLGAGAGAYESGDNMLERRGANAPRAQKARPGLTVELVGSNYGRPYPPPGGEKELAVPNHGTDGYGTHGDEADGQRANGHGANGHGANGRGANGYGAGGNGANGYEVNGYGANGHGASGYGMNEAAPTPVPTATSNGESGSWLVALQEIQRQTSEAHAAYQHALADGHAAYLRTSEATLSGMVAALDGTGRLPANGRAAAPPSPPRLPTRAPASVPAPAPAPSPRSPWPEPTVRQAPATVPAPALIPAAIPAAVAPPAARTPEIPPRPAAAGPVNADLEDVVISVIADLTGYPIDVLQPDMELEHDLGIDSIKRVQILSRVRDRVPDLPSVDPAQLAGLSSIGETVAYLRRQGNSRQSSPSADSEGEPSPILSS